MPCLCADITERTRRPILPTHRARLRTSRRPRMYRVTLEETGELLQEFNPAEFPKGASGAQMAAARLAVREGAVRPVILSGPEGFTRRRYAPEYAGGSWRGYRVPCSVEGCPNWIHPLSAARREEATCREHFRRAPETQARGKRLTEARLRKREE